MFSSHAFDYINVLDRAADASWTRQNAIVHNIANADTPTYKRKDVEFQSVLEKELRSTKYNTLHSAVRHMDPSKLNAVSFTDYAGFAYRLDGNNVDIDTENVELASEQLQYQALTTSIKGEFAKFRTVLK